MKAPVGFYRATFAMRVRMCFVHVCLLKNQDEGPGPDGSSVWGSDMADKRMFNKKVIESDEFLTLPHGAQVLYLHLSLNADDEGFLNNARTVIAMCDCDKTDLDILLQSGFVMQASPAVYCITHWFQNNQIRTDRFHPSMFADAKRNLIRIDGVWKLRDIFNDDDMEI